VLTTVKLKLATVLVILIVLIYVLLIILFDVLRLHCPTHKSSDDVDLSVWIREGFSNSRSAITCRSLLQQLDHVVKCKWFHLSLFFCRRRCPFACFVMKIFIHHIIVIIG